MSSCTKEQQTYTQTITSTEGMLEAELTYEQSEATIVASKLALESLTYSKVGDADVSISVTDVHGTSTFNNVPSKYINLDASVEITRNVFQPYFPEEWEPMKGQPYTTLYIRSNQDNQVFYMQSVFTNTDKEIGKYSEDF
ncbi:MAG: hypothetical protein ACPGTP_02110 [Bacteroidia bacterium]